MSAEIDNSSALIETIRIKIGPVSAAIVRHLLDRGHAIKVDIVNGTPDNDWHSFIFVRKYLNGALCPVLAHVSESFVAIAAHGDSLQFGLDAASPTFLEEFEAAICDLRSKVPEHHTARCDV